MAATLHHTGRTDSESESDPRKGVWRQAEAAQWLSRRWSSWSPAGRWRRGTADAAAPAFRGRARSGRGGASIRTLSQDWRLWTAPGRDVREDSGRLSESSGDGDSAARREPHLTMMCRSSWVGPGASKLSQESVERRYSTVVPAMLYSPGMLIFQSPLMMNCERPFCRAGEVTHQSASLGDSDA